METYLSLIRRVFRRAKFEILDKPRGLGRPICAQVWNADYQAGNWRHLESLSEHAHYSIIASYIAAFGTNADVLDMGCGAGVLTRYLYPSSYRHYCGVDVSTAAIGQAMRFGSDGVIEFKQGNFDTWISENRFDIIVFNESLYYARDARATLERFIDTLSPNGWLIVSMHHYGSHHYAVWRRVETAFSVMHSTHVENEKGQKWSIKVLRPKIMLDQPVSSS
jgi:trans-aconitate methyltransferase